MNALRFPRFVALPHCLRGHDFTPENTIVRLDDFGNPRRECRTCRRERDREWQKARRRRG